MKAMFFALIYAATVPLLMMLNAAIWVLAPERRVARTAVAAGLVVGRVAAGRAW